MLALISLAQCWEGADEGSILVLGRQLFEEAEKLWKENTVEYPRHLSIVFSV